MNKVYGSKRNNVIRFCVFVSCLLVFSSKANAIDWSCATSSSAWSNRYSPTMISYRDSLWIVRGSTAESQVIRDVWRSHDGTTWNSVCDSIPIPMAGGFGCVVFQDKLWAIAGFEGC